MAKVSLRVYNREIEGMIEGGKLEEAVAHCQHILKIYPMHVEIYRLLGKSLLEARRYSDAADIFQRVLMAVPDDFVAHVGMSIIRDDEGKLDDAIWHMERAFEGQPSNPAIQGELRRLYGRRDGVEPPKIRLSRDALANMYAQGELFNQAIAEIRAVLAEDANRPDLQVMLARAYYHSGQKVEAAEMAANLLKKYAYCMDALRILVDVLPGSARAESTQVYRQRLRLLDPYSSFATGSVFNTDQVPDTSITLERLEYTPGTDLSTPQPNWASSLGIKLMDERKSEPAPDWLKTGDASDPFAAPGMISSETPLQPADDKSVPDWMRTGGWQESSGNTQEEPAESSVEQPPEQLAKADIPDWLKAMAPQEMNETISDSEPAPKKFPSAGSGNIPDWLTGMETGPAVENASSGPTTVNVPSAGESEIPDWLAAAGVVATGENVVSEPKPDSPASDKEGDLPEWLAGLRTGVKEEDPSVESTQVNIPSAGDIKIPGWMDAEDSVATGADAVAEPILDTPPLAENEDLPEWLAAIGNGLPAENTDSETPRVNFPSAGEGEIPDWLAESGIATTEPAGGSEPVSTNPPVPNEGQIPDWLSDNGIVQAPVSSQPQDSTEPAPSAPVVQESATELADSSLRAEDDIPFQPTGESKALNIEDDTMAWLEGLAAKQGAKEEELLTKPEDRLGDIPDWLRPVEEQPLSPAAPEPSPAPLATTPLEMLSIPGAEQKSQESALAEGTASPLDFEDDSMAWLDGLAAKQGAIEEELLSKPEDHLGDIPDWLRPAGEQPLSSAAPEPSPAPLTTTPLEILSIPGAELTSQDSTPAEGLPGLVSPAEGTASPLNIEDDTMAWLEGLAAKQGAKEEELLSKPEDRLGDIPDWLRPAGEQPLATTAPEPSPAPLETTPLEMLFIPGSESNSQESAPAEDLPGLVSSAEETASPLNSEDDTMAWLDDLAVEQGAKEELLSKPEDHLEEIPEWLLSVSEPPSTIIPSEPFPAHKESLPLEEVTPQVGEFEVLEQATSNLQPVSEEIPAVAIPANEIAQPPQDESLAWLDDLEFDHDTKPEETLPVGTDHGQASFDLVQASKPEPAAPIEIPASESQQEDMSITSWLSKLDIEEALGKQQPAPEATQPISSQPDELPDWLKELEKPPAPPETSQPAQQLPDWDPQPIQSDENQASVFPTPASDLESELPSWVDEETPVSQISEATTPGEWVPIDEKPSPTPIAEPTAEPVSVDIELPVIAENIGTTSMVAETPIQPRVLKGTGMLARIPAKEKDAEFLAAAQAALDANKLVEAMQGYANLIKKNRLLDEVIHDLREAIYRFPVDIIVWQTLGDASMRANRLQDALDAYTKAEELLR